MIRRSSPRPLLVAVLCSLLAGTALGEESHREFLQGLRERLYFDTALEFIDDVEARPGLDDATKSLLVYERAITLQEYAQIHRDPDERVRMFDRAEQLLASFVKDNPSDPRLADANSRRAKILLDKAESEVYRAESPGNAAQSSTLRERARGYVEQARKVFTTARAQHQKRYESFPKFTEDDNVRDERTEAEYQMIQARIDLAMCTYMEARTHPEKDAARVRLFGQAAEEFRAIRDDHRLQIAGMHAELWEAKCYEEQGQLDRAIPLYDRLVKPGENEDPRNISPVLQDIRDQALRFKLGCWNKKEEWRLVYNAANDDDGWLRTAGRRANGLNGLGIRWELARAEEQLAKNARAEAARLTAVAVAAEKRSKDRDLKGVERTAAAKIGRDAEKAAGEQKEAYEDLLNSALRRAREIAQYATHYQEVAILMSNRIQVELDGDTKAPESFKEGFVQLQLKIGEVQVAARAVAEADDETRAERQEQQRQLLASTARLARLTIDLAPVSEEVDEEDLDRAWYLYAYVHYQSDNPWETAVIGRYLLRTRKTTNPQTAREGAFLAVAAMESAYTAKRAAARRNGVEPDGSEEAEFTLLESIASELVSTWPTEKLSDDARLIVGEALARRGEPARAAEWFTGVSENSPAYLEAQLKAGQGYFGAYARSANAPDGERPPQETLDGWRTKAVEHLRIGVEKKQAETPANAPEGERFELIRGKITLAETLIADGREQEAADLLVNDPHSVLKAIDVEPGAERPKKGLKSTTFAQSTYTLLLRAYIGLQKIDEALQAMDQLEAVSDGATVDLYQGLGRELQKEIERLRGLGQDERLVAVRTAFDVFLAKVYENRDQLGYNSLLWIATTYYSLGSGMGDDPAAGEYFQKSGDTFADILGNATADPEFAPDANLTAVRLQLVRCRGLQGEYDVAYELGLEVLAELPNAMDAQFEVSRVLQGWAESAPPDAVDKFRRAMLGGKVTTGEGRPVEVYGYKKIADVYGHALQTGRLEDEKGLGRLIDSYYNLVASQRGLSLAEDSSAKREAGLKRAVMLFAGVRNLGGKLDDEQKARFQDLHDTVHDDLGLPHAGINWPTNVDPTPPPPPPKPAPSKTKVAKKDDTSAKDEEESGGGILLMVVGLMIAIGAGVGAWFLMSQPKKRGPAYSFQANESEPTFAATASSTGTPRRKKAKQPEGTKTATRNPAEGERPKAKKKRPRPPE